MQIGQAAERTGLSIRTLRHYEEVGLVAPSERSTGGFRLYTEDDISRLMVIRRMKPLDFTLAEMRQLLDALDQLRDANSAQETRVAAAEVLAGFHQRAQHAVQRLRKHLDYAEELTNVLARHSADPEGSGR
ncbi:MerR family transcriptional regulator [Hoyosella sp. YIM 151337]|uniref:MerR family transcriptional regulator n=1 Tax=Hoyosella sp. YIM 151337 TaxID=2992742 RepID=UPI0022369158|nr:MerR family transcriptional regulator [Hoyosella sp. YIM 151337]MCW4354926.1 MerR family transcriptional regulator [Hoyosella sp. YIM 151337]